jgi:hypothetical protein
MGVSYGPAEDPDAARCEPGDVDNDEQNQRRCNPNRSEAGADQHPYCRRHPDPDCRRQPGNSLPRAEDCSRPEETDPGGDRGGDTNGITSPVDQGCVAENRD